MVLIGLLILIGIGSFAYNQYLINQMLQQERYSVELWAKAVEHTSNPVQEEISRKLLAAAEQLRNNYAVPDSITRLIEEAEADRTSQNFVTSEILLKEDRPRIPAIIVDERGDIIFGRDIEGELDSSLIKRFADMHDPIEIRLGNDRYYQMQYVYYGESPTIRLLRYFPYIQLSLLALLLGIAYVSYRTITRSEQSNLWVGMTKEAAHQLGTPLSSLYGWIELLREEKKEDAFTQKICRELENDITRLRGVSDRFNKVGSEPELVSERIAPILHQVIDYMEGRLPQLGKNVQVERDIDPQVIAKVNPELFQWAVENLIKNAMDALISNQGNAFVSVRAHRIENELMIDVEDSGQGIEKKYHTEVFKPGYSKKKRGWGLGLSLTRRIVEDYHKGKVFVLRSELKKGTTIRIVLKTEGQKMSVN
jgi:signal transduction histidine kinase